MIDTMSMLVLLLFVLVAVWFGVFWYLKIKQRAWDEKRAVETGLEQTLIQQLRDDVVLHQQNFHEKELSESGTRIAMGGLQQTLQEQQERIEKLELDCKGLRNENSILIEKSAGLAAAIEEQAGSHKEKLELLQQAKESMSNEFKSLANEIFESKQTTFKAQSKEQLDTVLNPLSERIKEFQAKVESNYNEESKERFSLRNELKSLKELNTRISKDAINLTNALKGESKTQGTWGEVILERVLEKSGLERGREYETQVSLISEEGRRFQPDVVVHLPEGKDIIIDSKVSLTAYERYCSSDQEEERARSLSEHIQSLRTHVKQLGEKDYQTLSGVRSLDFVLMFVPVEAAFSMAVQQDNSLFADAFSRNIVIVAPSTLLATLRTIQNIWRYEQQSKNAQQIAVKAGALYDKFVGFVQDLELIGSRLRSVQTAYDDAHKKMKSGKGNLIGRAQAMKQLGAEASKSLPKILLDNQSDSDLDHIADVDQEP
ncbi:MAG: DNA recombination protein RmuC [Gammaproteobacteria bacterium]|jgi:DNA recombination protein RmuC|nr:DNA recombination protein RmuC [Gammaproteobacteria bacterium]MBT5203980.1 DNA recombination protein RmuC [Gammaproteobacteria bacterium]MBT5600812.1 DNA recombination protein RmuC [Gammaproteobacteria bacterium]